MAPPVKREVKAEEGGGSWAAGTRLANAHRHTNTIVHSFCFVKLVLVAAVQYMFEQNLKYCFTGSRLDFKWCRAMNYPLCIQFYSTYGFRKVNPDRWEFANEAFLAGQKHLLKNIKRRRVSKNLVDSQLINETSISFGQPDALGVVESLKRDRAALRAEVIMLKKQYNNCKSQLIAMEEMVLNIERKQQQTVSFFARVLNNPVFVQQVLLDYVKKNGLRGPDKRQRLMENEEQHADLPLNKGVESASATEADVSAVSSGCGTVGKGESTPYWNAQNIDNLCDDIWEELDALPGTGMEPEDKAGIGFDVEEFVGRPCGWVDDCPYLVEPMQFVEH
ncbi:hypothetical protein ABZP36_014912 [Zizania latifolia]